MQRFLLAIGCNTEKLDQIDKKMHRRLYDFLNTRAYTDYDRVVSIVRKDEETTLDYQTDSVIEVPGFDLPVDKFIHTAEYYLVGISFSASVLSTAFSLYSLGRKVYILEDLCANRSTAPRSIYSAAESIIEFYMPGILLSGGY